MRHIVVYFAVLFSMFEYCFAQEPQKKLCVDGYELSFFTKLLKNNSATKEACNNYDSRLVKVDNPKITKAIDSLIMKEKTAFYIDGKAAANRTWTWSDGSKIYLRGDNSGYQNWHSDQPNDYDGTEDCIIVGRRTSKWKDSRCDEKLGYICQRDFDPCTKVDSSIPNIHKCIATGSSSPQVEWRKGIALRKVTTNVNRTTYQTKVSEGSILYFENASIGDAGNYACAAWTSVNGNKSVSKRVTINVSGKPSILNIKSSPCNSSLPITWKPNQRAIGFPHKINASDKTGLDHFKDFVTPTEQVEQLTEISGLQLGTEYNITVAACQYKERCSDRNTARALATTNERGEVTNAFLIQLNDKTCNVTWSWPYDITGNKSLKFEIILNEEKHYVNASQRPFFYSFEPMESSYGIKVQSLESVNICGYVEAVGTCTKKNDFETAKLLKIIIPVTIASLLIILGLIVAILRIRKKYEVMNPIQQDVNVVNQIADSVEYYNAHEYEKVADVKTSGVAQANVDVVYQNCAYNDTASSVYVN